MDTKTKKLLRSLADKYEVAEFVNGDPSCILKRYKSVRDTEVASFVMALLSFGQREQFLKKADYIFELCAGHPADWFKSGAWQKDFPSGEKKFYRFYSYDDMRKVFAKMQEILETHKTFGDAVRKAYETAVASASTSASAEASASAGLAYANPARVAHKSHIATCENTRPDLACVIGEMFFGCAIVPQTKTSANKRVNMFLRWMVRQNSPVDLGLWKWFSPSDLIIPLDTHVLQVAKSLALLPPKATGSAKTAAALTDALREVFPDDPVRGDFALFGVGVDDSK